MEPGVSPEHCGPGSSCVPSSLLCLSCSHPPPRWAPRPRLPSAADVGRDAKALVTAAGKHRRGPGEKSGCRWAFVWAPKGVFQAVSRLCPTYHLSLFYNYPVAIVET